MMLMSVIVMTVMMMMMMMTMMIRMYDDEDDDDDDDDDDTNGFIQCRSLSVAELSELEIHGPLVIIRMGFRGTLYYYTAQGL